jgi:hypothetical protein
MTMSSRGRRDQSYLATGGETEARCNGLHCIAARCRSATASCTATEPVAVLQWSPLPCCNGARCRAATEPLALLQWSPLPCCNGARCPAAMEPVAVLQWSPLPCCNGARCRAATEPVAALASSGSLPIAAAEGSRSRGAHRLLLVLLATGPPCVWAASLLFLLASCPPCFYSSLLLVLPATCPPCFLPSLLLFLLASCPPCFLPSLCLGRLASGLGGSMVLGGPLRASGPPSLRVQRRLHRD